MKNFKLYKLSGSLVIILLLLTLGGKAFGQGVRQVHLIINPKPTVNFGKSENLLLPMTVDFSDSSTINPGSITGWLWDFGDGNTSTLRNPRHTYNAFGYYNVTLTAETQAGCTATITKAVLVGNTGSVNIAVNKPIQCAADNSFVYGGTGVPAGFTYQWDFGDGNVSDLVNPTYHYAASGTFNVRLIVIEATPSILRDTAYLTVKVIPSPNVNGLNHVYCHGEEVPTYYFTGNTPGAIYKWNRIIGHDLGIGLGNTSGNDSMPAFTAQNIGIQYLTAAYRATPYYTSDGLTCQGTGENFLITVNPVPKITEVRDRVYQNRQEVEAYTFTGNTNDANYTWRFLNGDVIQGLPANGNNWMPSFTAINDGGTAVMAQYEVLSDYTYANKTCTGIGDTFSVTILPNSSVTFANYTKICGSASEAMFLCDNNSTAFPLYHKILFSEKALEAGFLNMEDFALLTDSVRIAIPSGVQAGQYVGHLYVKNDYVGNVEAYDFVIDIMKPTRIVQQPNDQLGMCNDGGFIHLEVVAEGANLNYQWYKNGAKIDAATDAVYEKSTADSSDFGAYTVVVTGNCGTAMSAEGNVELNKLVVLQKWNDVLFVSNRDSSGNKRGITAYQWYRVYSDGGMAIINEKGQSQYYSEKGIEGTFAVEVTFSDGSTQMSCPYTIITSQKAVVKIYPNPVGAKEKLNVSLDLAGNTTDGAVIEVFDELGILVDRKTATGNITEFYLNVPSATYIFRITEPDGTVTSQKIIIR